MATDTGWRGALRSARATAGRIAERVAERVADDWLAPCCALCAAATTDFAPATRGLCRDCTRLLPQAGVPRCRVCACVVAGAQERCPGCIAQAPAFDATLTLATYAPPVDRWITALKFGRDPGLARALGELLAARLAASGRPIPDLVVPVPLGPARLAGRGFNQAYEIARPIARALGLRVEAGLLARRRETAPQSTLARQARAANLRGAFAVDLPRTRGAPHAASGRAWRAGAHDGARALEGRVVAVVDDVMTTGATLGAVATALRNAGARRVINLVACRA